MAASTAASDSYRGIQSAVSRIRPGGARAVSHVSTAQLAACPPAAGGIAGGIAGVIQQQVSNCAAWVACWSARKLSRVTWAR